MGIPIRSHLFVYCIHLPRAAATENRVSVLIRMQ